MKKLSYPLLLLLFVCSLAVHAKDTPAPRYIDPTTVDLKTLLPDPPVAGTPENDKEIQAVLAKQKTRTPVDVARAESEVKLTVFVFGKIVGPWFTAENLPLTAALFQNVNDDTHLVTDQAKKIWNRPRPPLQDKTVKPAVELEQTGSYPSGHATRGLLYAMILADMDPDAKDQLIPRGKLVGEDRVIGGVHFPSDVAAGQTLAAVLYAKFTASPTFQADFAKAKAEFDAARAKSLAPAAN